MKTARILLTVLAALLLLFTAACSAGPAGEGDVTSEEETRPEEGTEEVKTGVIEIRVTDPPPADVRSAFVQLNNVEVHKAAADNSSDSQGEWIMLLESPASFNLMDVIGIEQLLGSVTVEDGKYTQIRMDVTEVTGETTDNVSYSAEVPGDKLKIVRSFTVEAGTTTIVTLDFDGEQSLIVKGNGQYAFKPVVKLSVVHGVEPEREQEGMELSFEGTIKAINGDNWTVTATTELRSADVTVDVSGAEIIGEPAVGLDVEIDGTMTADIVIAEKIVVKEPEA
jgi:hypothetical protein